MAAPQMYRGTTLGHCLVDALDEMIQSQRINVTAKNQVLMNFDKAMSVSLSQKVKNKVNFKVNFKPFIR